MTQAAKSMNVRVDYVTRVEGHGNIVAKVEDGQLVDTRFEVTESPRFFEAMLRGRSWKDAMFLTTRICGICACGHGSASLRATEDAMGITISEQTERLRKIVLHAEQLESHWLHCYFLVAPDFFGAPSVITMAATHTDVILRAMRPAQCTPWHRDRFRIGGLRDRAPPESGPSPDAVGCDSSRVAPMIATVSRR